MGEIRPEQEPHPGSGLVVDALPAGAEWDTRAPTTLIAVGDAYGATRADLQGVTLEFAGSYQRQGVDPDARIAAAVTELERLWGPEDGARFQMMLDRAEQELKHLHPTLPRSLRASGAIGTPGASSCWPTCGSGGIRGRDEHGELGHASRLPTQRPLRRRVHACDRLLAVLRL